MNSATKAAQYRCRRQRIDLTRWGSHMSGLLIGYARVSTEEQDLTAQRDGLAALGVEPGHIHVDHGLTGTNRERPGLREALPACRAGDTLVVTNSTGWPSNCPTRGRSPRTLPSARCDSASARRCMTRPTRDR
jgi:Resolvase, N terminal domain